MKFCTFSYESILVFNYYWFDFYNKNMELNNFFFNLNYSTKFI